MLEMNKIRKGDILITEERMSGQLRQVYGPVFLIDTDRNLVGIKVGEDIRSFSPESLWTIHDFVKEKKQVSLILAVFIADVLKGKTDVYQDEVDRFANAVNYKKLREDRSIISVKEALQVINNL